MPKGDPVPPVASFFAWYGLAVSHTESVEYCAWVVVVGVMLSLSNHHHGAGDRVGLRHDVVENGVDHAPTVVVRVLCGRGWRCTVPLRQVGVLGSRSHPC